jgi:hypothetical protein
MQEDKEGTVKTISIPKIESLRAANSVSRLPLLTSERDDRNTFKSDIAISTSQNTVKRASLKLTLNLPKSSSANKHEKLVVVEETQPKRDPKESWLRNMYKSTLFTEG